MRPIIEPLLKLVMLACLVLVGIAWWKREALPEPTVLRTELEQEPLQEPVHAAPFQAKVKGVTYTVKPLYRYEIWGLVVSRHDAKSWWDIVHKETHDHLNVVDLCVVYGSNARSGVYNEFSYSSGQWTCYFQTRSNESMQRFDMTGLSNNHVLTDNATLAKKLRQVRIGDQIRLEGYLAEYSHNHGFPFHRGTSTTRTDTGNGACETIFVQDAEILRAGGTPWRAVWWAAWIGLAASIAGWLQLPYRARD